ncbi:fatty acyl-AMP ligase [Dulcicalothrix desertica]|nr:fatty acyl-AMP ligase [Dulcicalothrix desertica]
MLDSSNFINSLDKIDSLIKLLKYRAQQKPEKIVYRFLLNGESETCSLTYQQLDIQAQAIAAQLQRMGVSGKCALLLYAPGLEFISAFFGCLYAGVIAVPAYPPRENQNLTRLLTIAKDSQAAIVLTTASLLPNIKKRWVENLEMPPISWLATDSIEQSQESCCSEPLITSDTLAFLQYTSGSTGQPKGVMVSHQNLLHNSELIEQRFENTSNSIIVSWLPPYHDMGLIGGILQPLYVGASMILMPPVAFLQKPFRWLQTISQYKATTSGAPNFAYEMCVRRISPEQQETLDLSCWEVAFNGAEPIRFEVLEQFVEKFASCGFRANAFYPCYGMAEATLLVTGGAKAEAPIIKTVMASELEQNRIVTTSESQKYSRTIVSCGRSCYDQKVIIVDPEFLTELPAGKVGEIWVAGASVTSGYWNQPEKTQQSFRAYLTDTKEGPFLRTGDLGFMENGELFVTGRLKNVIIIRGRNHYAQDIEKTVEESDPFIRPYCSAAFAVEIEGVERLVVVAEVERRYKRRQLGGKFSGVERRQVDIEANFDLETDKQFDQETVVSNIQEAVTREHGLQIYSILLLKTGSIPKTSSGKIQHYACRAGFLDGTLNILTTGS